MRLFYFVLISVVALGCSDSKTKRTELFHYLPDKASVIIKTENFEGLSSSLYNNDFIKEFDKKHVSLEDKMKFTSLLKPNVTTLIALGKNREDSLIITLVTKYHDKLFKRDSIKDYKEETFSFKGKDIIKSQLKNHVFYSTVIDSIFITSNDRAIVEDSFNNALFDSDLEKIYSTTNANQSVSVLLKSENPFIKFPFVNDSLALPTFTDYLALDFDITQNSINFNGITKSKDSTGLVNIFKHTIPQENKMPYLTPSNSDGFLSITFNDFQTFYKNLCVFRNNDTISLETSLFDNVIEIGVVYEAENRAVILNSIDVIATNDALLSEQDLIDSYRQVDIYNFSQSVLFSDILNPFIHSKNFSVYGKVDDYYIFANSMDILQNIIANYQNQTTLRDRSYYETIHKKLSDASSLLWVVNDKTLARIASNNSSTEMAFDFNGYKASALQFIFDKDFAHVHGIIQKERAQVYENSISEEFSIKLDADLLNEPQFVNNHITKQKEIVVQDVGNNLYLISNEGKVLWKKQLHGPVLGKIEQIDIYKNGRLQLVFATPHRLYVLDRNGDDVAPFPAKFNDEITQPLSVFDYDKRKNYRLFVTQGKNLLMYNTKGKIVSGFNFKQANDNVITQPQHFRIGSKDYLTVKTANKLYILDRTGADRATPKTNHSYSSEAIYYHDNTFETTTSAGNLLSIDTKGNTNLENLNLSANHHIDASTKTMVTLSENRLTIRNKTIELDYGNYTAPKFYYINDKIYVATTDLQTQKVYLFDSQTKSIPNFPVYGNSSIDLDNIDKDRNLEFVTKGDSDTILLYQIN